jgi:CHAD domain-containing protein
MHDSATFALLVADYHAERWRHASQYLKQVIKKKNKDDAIHMARVEIKKMRSLYELIDHADGSSDGKKQLKPLLDIFKLMGQLRDDSNMHLLCHQFKIDPKALGKQHDIKTAYKKLEGKIEKHRDSFRKIKKRNTARLKKITAGAWEIYIREKHYDILRMLGTAPTDDDLHEVRKEIKHLLNNMKLSPQHANELVKEKEAGELDKLQDMIGCWHDCVLLASWLKKQGYHLSHRRQYAAILTQEKQLRKQIEY